MSEAPIRPEITSDSQRYVDEPIWEEIRALMLPFSIQCAYPRTVSPDHRLARVMRLFKGWRRVPLRRMVPDGKGGLVPKFARDH